MVKLLGISGALRRESTNTMLVREAARVFGEADFTLADLRLPLYDADLEAEGMPEEVTRLAAQVAGSDAIVISTPEYNKAPPGVLKNALDWLSRPRPAPMAGKPVAVVSASAGIAGGQRAKSIAYLNLIPFSVRLVTDPEVNVGGSSKRFDANGRLTDEMAEKLLTDLMANLRAAI